MKTISTIFCLALLLSACLSEKNAEPGKGATFIRYYSGGYNDEAITFEETSDKGFILLGSIRIVTSAAEPPKYRIKLIKTDDCVVKPKATEIGSCIIVAKVDQF